MSYKLLHPILWVVETRFIASLHRFNNGFSPSLERSAKIQNFRLRLGESKILWRPNGIKLLYFCSEKTIFD